MKRNIGIKICTLIAALLIATTALFGCEKTTVPDNPEPAPTPDEPSKTATLSTEEVAAIGERLAVEVARVPDRTGTGIIIAADDESVTVVTCYHVAEYDAAHAEFRFNGDSEFIGGRSAWGIRRSSTSRFSRLKRRITSSARSNARLGFGKKARRLL